MPLEIQIPDGDIEFLNDPAKQELASAVNAYIDELLGEASRLEAAQNTTGGDPEITSSMVRDATVFLKRGYKKPKKSRWIVVSQILAAMATLVTGILLDLESLKNPLMLVVFVFTLLVATVFTVLTILRE